MYTIKDVAKLAGVSISTVSLALNKPERVSEVTREKVLDAVKELDYIPNYAARNMKLQDKRKAVALITGPISGPYHYDLIRGIQETFAINKLDLLFISDYDLTGKTPSRFLTNLIKDDFYSGTIILNYSNPVLDDEIEIASKSGLPIVLIGRKTSNKKISSICVDNIGSGIMMANHLISLGYRRLGIMGDQCDDKIDRIKGFLCELEKHDIYVKKEWFVPGEYTENSGYKNMKKFIESGLEMPEAFFCINDELAIGAISALRDHGYAIPDQVAVTGCDDIIQAKYFHPSLTTIVQPKFEQGLLAANLLIRAITYGYNDHIIMNTRLVVRESCGAQSER